MARKMLLTLGLTLIFFSRGTPVYLIGMMPKILRQLNNESSYTMVRIKNRFLSDYEPIDSAGYRDCQLLAQLPDGWIVEIQIIPREIYNLKSHLASQKKEVGHGMATLTGHDAYKPPARRSSRGPRPRRARARRGRSA